LFTRIKKVNIFAALFDVVTAFFFAIWALIIGPLGVLRGPLSLDRISMYMWVLLPQGLLSRFVKTTIDWRLGNFDAAIGQLESLIDHTQVYYMQKPESHTRLNVLEDLFTLLTRAYLHAGHMDDAMHVVIRAKKNLGIDRLPGLAELDAKTAHLVRAGLAAGRLLEGDGLATMFVKSNHSSKSDKADRSNQDGNGRKGASSLPFDDGEDLLEEDDMSNVIYVPFGKPDNSEY